MTIKALEGLTPTWYTPREEEDNKEQGAAFFLKPLTGPQLLEVQPHFDLENTTVRGPGLVMSVRFGLKGWKNVVDSKGAEMAFNPMRIDFLPSEILAELGAEILRMSMLGDDEIKNS